MVFHDLWIAIWWSSLNIRLKCSLTFSIDLAKTQWWDLAFRFPTSSKLIKKMHCFTVCQSLILWVLHSVQCILGEGYTKIKCYVFLVFLKNTVFWLCFLTEKLFLFDPRNWRTDCSKLSWINYGVLVWWLLLPILPYYGKTRIKFLLRQEQIII